MRHVRDAHVRDAHVHVLLPRTCRPSACTNRQKALEGCSCPKSFSGRVSSWISGIAKRYSCQGLGTLQEGNVIYLVGAHFL